MSLTDYEVHYIPGDGTLHAIESYLPNTSEEGALEFFLADKGFTPADGDDAFVSLQKDRLGPGKHFYWEADDVTDPETGEVSRQLVRKVYKSEENEA